MDTEMANAGAPSTTTAVDAAPALPDRARIAESAEPQALSPLFGLLPGEVRKLIYVEFWRLSSQRQHLYREPHGRGMAHFPCLTDGGGSGFGPKSIRCSPEGFHAECHPGAGEAASWDRGLMTDWNLHWSCQKHLEKTIERAHAEEGEQADQGEGSADSSAKTEKLADDGCKDNCPSSAWSPFMPVMLACKRLYLECSESIYDTVTFHLTETAQAADFVTSCLRAGLTCRSLEISLRFTPLLTELYFDGRARAIIKGDPDPVTAANNPWQRLCDALVRASSKDLAAGGGLRDLRMWIDSSDLRPWHKRVYENRFFARLLDVQRPLGDFIVDVPAIPDEPEERGLPGMYLEDVPRDRVPFEIVRSTRTNNWMLHIQRISHMRATSQN